MNAKAGDKIRIKTGSRAGRRGVVNKVRKSKMLIRLEDSGELVEVVDTDTINFSLAARKAWARMPDRRVGRPKGTTKTDRVSVTLRMDRELWRRFQAAEADGVVEDRTATINAWIANRLNDLLSKE